MFGLRGQEGLERLHGLRRLSELHLGTPEEERGREEFRPTGVGGDLEVRDRLPWSPGHGEGHSEVQAQARLARHGPDVLAETPGRILEAAGRHRRLGPLERGLQVLALCWDGRDDSGEEKRREESAGERWSWVSHKKTADAGDVPHPPFSIAGSG